NVNYKNKLDAGADLEKKCYYITANIICTITPISSLTQGLEVKAEYGTLFSQILSVAADLSGLKRAIEGCPMAVPPTGNSAHNATSLHHTQLMEQELPLFFE
ncbi:hypothetical protein ACJX0J_007269, partial [Zea mays]